MSRSKRISASQRRMFVFLKNCEQKGTNFSLSRLANAAGVQADTIGTYISKGYFANFLIPVGDDKYSVQGLTKLTEVSFINILLKLRVSENSDIPVGIRFQERYYENQKIT